MIRMQHRLLWGSTRRLIYTDPRLITGKQQMIRCETWTFAGVIFKGSALIAQYQIALLNGNYPILAGPMPIKTSSSIP